MQPVVCPVHAGKSVKELSNSALPGVVLKRWHPLLWISGFKSFSREFSSQQRADGSVTSFCLYECMFTFCVSAEKTWTKNSVCLCWPWNWKSTQTCFSNQVVWIKLVLHLKSQRCVGVLLQVPVRRWKTIQAVRFHLHIITPTPPRSSGQPGAFFFLFFNFLLHVE